MTDKKISALAAATALAGTEVLPLVQGGVTVKATVDQILTPAAAKGINFTANTPAAGMTSQLLNWYEEGTWTPTDTSGAGLSLTVIKAVYQRIGNKVVAYAYITFPVTASTATAKIGGLPFTVGSNIFSPSIISSTLGTPIGYRTSSGSENMFVMNIFANTDYTNVNLSGVFLISTITYFI